jgi:hypothetical protein
MKDPMTDTHPDAPSIDVQEQLIRIAQRQAESEKFAAETRKLFAEADKLRADTHWQPVVAWAALLTAFGALGTAVLTVLLKH